MQKVTRYVSHDGSEYGSEEEAVKHDARLIGIARQITRHIKRSENPLVQGMDMFQLVDALEAGAVILVKGEVPAPTAPTAPTE